MAAIKSEMPPLHAPEPLVGATGVGGSNGNSSSGANGVGNSNSNNSVSNASATVNANSSSVNAVNNTISAAADSSDNQPSTPQPQQIIGNDQQQQSATSISHHPYAAHHMYAAASTGATTTASLPHMYSAGIYATAGQDIQQQQQQQQQQQHVGYPSYLNSYEQFYQQQAHAQSQGGSNIDYGNSSLMYGNEYKSPNVRYHPYLQTPTSGIPSSSNSGNGNGNSGSGIAAGAENPTGDIHDSANASATTAAVSSASMVPLQNSSTAVSTTTAMSPRVVSSTSPTSTSSNLQLGNPISPGNKLQCKKCGIMCTNESDLQEHITNVHGASPYGSSGYSSSPYIKEELSSHQGSSGGNPGNLLDLDSQKMVYPPPPGSMQALLHHPHHQQMQDALGANDPLHSMHSMQQRALPTWNQQAVAPLDEGLPAYMQSHESKGPSNQSPYYSPKQSPYHISGGSNASIKQEYPIIKSEYADSQNYLDKSFDPTGASDLCAHPVPSSQQQPQQMMPVSSSPAEFPSTTTGPLDQQQQYRGFEPPTSSSVLPANNITAKAATWKSNEARRPKTYNCTACNKWFTSSGHLKRHYNTTLHKNAVKSSGQPDPATLPISAHHHPARDPSGKAHRRGGSSSSSAAAAAQQQQQPPAPVQPPEPPRSPPDYASQGMGPMSHYSTSPSPTQLSQQPNGGIGIGGLSYAQAQQNGYTQSQSQYMHQVQSTTNASPQHASNNNLTGNSPTQQTVLNGHPNGLAGPSDQATPTQMPSSHTRGLLNTTITVTTKIEPMEDNSNNTLTHSQMDMDMEMDMGTLQHHPDHQHPPHPHQQSEQQELELQQGEAEALGVLEVLEESRQPQYHQLEPLASDHQRQYHNSTPSSTRSMQAPSPLIISHQQYQEQLQQQRQQLQQQQPQLPMGDTIFSHTPAQPDRQVHMLPPNIMEQQQYNIIPLAISTPQHSSSMQLPPLQQHITTSTATTNMDSIHTMVRSLPHHQPHPDQQQQPELVHMHNTLHNNTSIHPSLGTISTTITPTPPPQPITTITPQQQQLQPLQQQQHITNTIPSFQQLQQQASGLAQLDHTMTYHTIIGSNNSISSTAAGHQSELLHLTTLDSYGNLQSQQMLQTADGQLLQFIPAAQMMGQPLFTLPTRAAVAESYAPLSHYTAQRSPQEADLPPAQTILPGGTTQTQESQTLTVLPSMPYSPTISSSTLTAMDDYTQEQHNTALQSQAQPQPHIKQDTLNISAQVHPDSSPAPFKKQRRSPTIAGKASAAKRKRVSVTSSETVMPSNKTVLPTGQIRCLECDKEFTKICYLTQHNKSFHSGEYPFRCQKCGKRFQCEDIYTTHLGRHKSQDKPHKCELCPKQFHHKTDLRRHIEAIHTGLKQHTCDVCQKSFCRKDHLRKHLETHNRPRTTQKKVSAAKGAAAKNGKKSPRRPARKMASPNQNVDSIDQIMLQINGGTTSLSSPSSSMHEQQPSVVTPISRQGGNHRQGGILGLLNHDDECDNDIAPDDDDLLEDDDDSNDRTLLIPMPCT